MSPPTRLEVVHAYRSLYRASLRAVQYSKPNRYTVRDQLRQAFRREDPFAFNQEKIHATVEFLNLAARERGLEHKIVKNLLHTRWWYNQRTTSKQHATQLKAHVSDNVMVHYNMTLAMLNASMGLCLR